MLGGGWVEVAALAAAFVIAVLATPAGISGAVLLLPFQVSVLGTPSPAVTPTNLLYNVVATPGALYRYWRQGQTGGQLALVLRGLTAQAKEPDLPLREVGSPITESLKLWRRAMGAWDHVPIRRIGDARPPGPGIDDDHAHVWDLGQANLRAVRGRERTWREASARA